MKMLLAFQKGEALRLLSHLDLLRTMQRVLRRSGLPVRYSQGFNPHMLTTFASALSMGAFSQEEIVEIGLTGPVDPAESLARVNAVLPEALKASQVVLVEDTHPALMGLLKQAEYTAWLNDVDVARITSAAQAMMAEEEVMAMRVSKRGEKLVNIRPMVHALSVVDENGAARFDMRVSLEEIATLKPELLIATIWERAGLPREAMPAIRLRRNRLLGVQDGQAVPLLLV